MTPFIDDIKASKNRLDAAQAAYDADHATAVASLRDALFTRLRPLPALGFANDAALNEACAAFADSLARNMLP